MGAGHGAVRPPPCTQWAGAGRRVGWRGVKCLVLVCVCAPHKLGSHDISLEANITCHPSHDAKRLHAGQRMRTTRFASQCSLDALLGSTHIDTAA